MSKKVPPCRGGKAKFPMSGYFGRNRLQGDWKTDRQSEATSRHLRTVATAGGKQDRKEGC